MAEEAGNSTQESTETTETTGTEGAGARTSETKEKMFSQQALNNLLAKQRRDLLGDATDVGELRQKAKAFDELQESSKSDLEKALARADKAEKARSEAFELANKRLIEAAFLAEATSQKAIKPEHLHRLIDHGSVTVGDDGQVTGVKEAVEGFLKANPEYVGRPSGSADQGARDHGGVKQLNRADLSTMSPEAIVKARAEGRTAVLEGRT